MQSSDLVLQTETKRQKSRYEVTNEVMDRMEVVLEM